MTYEIYRYIFFGGAILSGIMLILSVLLFFLYRIPNVLGDLTGSNARKAIENIRNQNESSGDKLYKTSQVNRERGKLTDKISPSGSLIRQPTGVLGGGAMATEKIGTQQLSPEELSGSDTEVLTSELIGGGETEVLSEGASPDTTVLNASDTNSGFAIEYEITFIHTDEVI